MFQFIDIQFLLFFAALCERGERSAFLADACLAITWLRLGSCPVAQAGFGLLNKQDLSIKKRPRIGL
jgi:hypothetical protein